MSTGYDRGSWWTHPYRTALPQKHEFPLGLLGSQLGSEGSIKLPLAHAYTHTHKTRTHSLTHTHKLDCLYPEHLSLIHETGGCSVR